MKKQRRWKIGVAALCAVAVLGGTYAFASAAAGSEGDPLVTLSYLKNVFTGQVSSLIDEKVAAGQESNKTQLDTAIQEWDAKVSEAVDKAKPEIPPDVPATFAAAAMNEGQAITIGAGCEIIVRTGAPVCSADLIDQTSGTLLSAGKSLTANHLYLATEQGTFSVPTTEITGVITADALNVRAGAGTGHAILGTIRKDTTVTIVDTSIEGWYMITGGGLAGYVSKDWVTLNPTTVYGPCDLLIRGEYTTG